MQGIAWFNEMTAVAEVMERFVQEASGTLERQGMFTKRPTT